MASPIGTPAGLPDPVGSPATGSRSAPATGAPTAGAAGSAAGTSATPKPGDASLTQERIDEMAVAGGGMPGLPPRTPSEVDGAVAALERAVETLQKGHSRRIVTAGFVALGGVVVGLILALAVAYTTVSSYQGRLIAATNAQINVINAEVDAQLARISAAARVAAIEKTPAPAQATAPAKAEGEKPATAEPKLAEPSAPPATGQGQAPAAAPPQVVAPVPAALTQPSAMDEARAKRAAILDALKKGMKEGGK